MLTRALILAAGKGIAVGDHSGPNCLATVGGVTLIERRPMPPMGHFSLIRYRKN